MSFVAMLTGENLLIQIGDGEEDETFAHDCLINGERSQEQSSEMSVIVVPRCDDPTQPGKTVRRKRSTDVGVSFSGMLHATSAKVWQDWAAGGAKNIRVKQQGAGATGGWTRAGAFFLENFTLGGTALEGQTCSGRLVQADETTLTANA